MSEPTAREVLALLADWLEAEQDEPSGPISAPMSARLEDASGAILTLDSTHLRALAAAQQAQAEAEAREAGLRAALEWYADSRNYTDIVFDGMGGGLPIYTTEMTEDNGSRARTALSPQENADE